MRKYQGNFICGITALGIGIAYGLSIPHQVSDFSEGYNISGRTLPYILALVMVACGLALTVISLVQRHRFSKMYEGVPTPPNPVSWGGHFRVILYVLLVILYTLGLCHVGFIVSTVIATIFAMLLSGAKNHIITIALSAAFALLLYAFFTLLMDVYFPGGILF